MGELYILVSGIAFGLLPWFARIAYGHGAEPLGMLAARFSIASVCMFMARLVLQRGRPWPKGKLLLQLFALGAIGYAPQATFFFSGIKRIDISLATVIFYTYPVMVVLASWIFLKHRPSKRMVACLTIAVVGAALTAGQVKTGSWAGIAFMLGAAGWYTGYIVLSSRVVHLAGALTSLTIVMFGAAVAHLTLLVMLHPSLPHGAAGWSAAGGAAFISTIIAMGFFFAGVSRVGPGEAAVLSTIEPVVSIAVGVIALNEHLNAARVAGAVLVLVGVAVLAQFSRTDAK